MKRIALTLILLALAGCSTTGTMGEIVGSWQGEHIDTVVQQWGVPDREYKTASGRTIYEWGSSTSGSMPTFATTTGHVSSTGHVHATTFTTPSHISGSCTRRLTADGDGKIINGAWGGSDCCVMAVAGRCAAWKNPAR